ncbi:hypothetical protein B566_EDAN017955, partial [Ephemera danica]
MFNSPETMRKYKRKPDARRYKFYFDGQLDAAINDVRNNTRTYREAAKFYNIPLATLFYKITKQHTKCHGGQTCVNQEEEELIKTHLLMLCDYGLPMDTYDLRVVTKMYLDRAGRTVNQFSKNLPGPDWARSFIRRHDLRQRISGNISQQRAAVSPEITNKFFDHYEKEIYGELNGVKVPIPPSNVWNYDETNLTDDPGHKRVICKRGLRYPERTVNASKSATSIMFCGNADGEMLPPYVVYKAARVYTSWTENGPPRARYNCSPSGWFDTNIFEDWFFSLALPRFRQLEGPVILTGDNLSSHISIKVLEACKENDIKLIFLPPNSTHLMQPLDVSFFHPMKVFWRRVVWEFKQSMAMKYINKCIFPSLLAKMMDALSVNGAKTLKNGFRKTGLYPVNRNAVLERLPGFTNSDVNLSVVSDAFLAYLHKQRYGDEDTPIRRRKKIDIPAGRSVSYDE